ncbi:hypothetical protein [Clostridium polynesiense]|uniref:hypothetical protein n=1 Tax=Clostridium polynesiense TaxID=1325933 RepID=UPI000A536940|nr:hypothetical protein [Clostridium polynesiense]
MSHPNKLNVVQQQFIEELIKEIRKSLLFPRSLPLSEQYPEPPLANIRRIILSSYGMISVNLKQRKVRLLENNINEQKEGNAWEGSPFAQIETAMAYQYGIPLLLIRETDVEKIGVWSLGIGPFVILEWSSEAENPVEEFFQRNHWNSIFQSWIGHVRTGYYIKTQPEYQYSCFNRSENMQI